MANTTGSVQNQRFPYVDNKEPQYRFSHTQRHLPEDEAFAYKKVWLMKREMICSIGTGTEDGMKTREGTVFPIIMPSHLDIYSHSYKAAVPPAPVGSSVDNAIYHHIAVH